MKEKNLPQPKVLVNLTGKLAQGFRFPQMSQYDFFNDQVNILEGAQANLNDNINNERLRGTFVQTAKEVEKALKEQYPNDWNSPLKY